MGFLCFGDRPKARNAQNVGEAHLYKALFGSINTKYKIFVNRLHGVLDIVEKINRITQMDCKSRDESNESN